MFSDLCDMKEVYLLLGSNRGDRHALLDSALSMIEGEGCSVVKTSARYESAPWGFDDETSFINQGAEIETELSPQDLMERLLKIEAKLGRVRSPGSCGCEIPKGDVRNAIGDEGSAISDEGSAMSDRKSPVASRASQYSSRTMDIDILFYGQKLIFDGDLMIPHPRLHVRRFTLVPLAEIAPEFVHPVMKKTMKELLGTCTDSGEARRIDN
jgi:2-amino-4-hydroxy-6-hydroxymethyldihydropteridine diphosphokinase